MFLHFIHYKGKGILVLMLPLALAGIMFMAASNFGWKDDLVPPFAFITAGSVLFLIDNHRKKIIEGTIVIRTVKLPREKRKNTFMWIEMRYWGIAVAAFGFIWLVNVV